MSNFKKIMVGLFVTITFNILSTANCLAMEKNNLPKKENISNQKAEKNNKYLKTGSEDDLDDSLFCININKSNNKLDKNNLLNKKRKIKKINTIDNNEGIYNAKEKAVILNLFELELKKELKTIENGKMKINNILETGFNNYNNEKNHKPIYFKDKKGDNLKIQKILVKKTKKVNNRYIIINLIFNNKNIDKNVLDLTRKIIKNYINPNKVKEDSTKSNLSIKNEETVEDTLIKRVFETIKKIINNSQNIKNLDIKYERFIKQSTFGTYLKKNGDTIFRNLLEKYEKDKNKEGIKDFKSKFLYFPCCVLKPKVINKDIYNAEEKAVILNLFEKELKKELTTIENGKMKITNILETGFNNYNNEKDHKPICFQDEKGDNLEIQKILIKKNSKPNPKYIKFDLIFNNEDIDKNILDLVRKIIKNYINPNKIKKSSTKSNLSIKNEETVKDALIERLFETIKKIINNSKNIKNLDIKHERFVKKSTIGTYLKKNGDTIFRNLLEKYEKDKNKEGIKDFISRFSYRSYISKPDVILDRNEANIINKINFNEENQSSIQDNDDHNSKISEKTHKNNFYYNINKVNSKNIENIESDNNNFISYKNKNYDDKNKLFEYNNVNNTKGKNKPLNDVNHNNDKNINDKNDNQNLINIDNNNENINKYYTNENFNNNDNDDENLLFNDDIDNSKYELFNYINVNNTEGKNKPLNDVNHANYKNVNDKNDNQNLINIDNNNENINKYYIDENFNNNVNKDENLLFNDDIDNSKYGLFNFINDDDENENRFFDYDNDSLNFLK